MGNVDVIVFMVFMLCLLYAQMGKNVLYFLPDTDRCELEYKVVRRLLHEQRIHILYRILYWRSSSLAIVALFSDLRFFFGHHICKEWLYGYCTQTSPSGGNNQVVAKDTDISFHPQSDA